MLLATNLCTLYILEGRIACIGDHRIPHFGGSFETSAGEPIWQMPHWIFMLASKRVSWSKEPTKRKSIHQVTTRLNGRDEASYNLLRIPHEGIVRTLDNVAVDHSQ